MKLISSELNLDNACDYQKAQDAIHQVLKDDEELAQNDMMEDDQASNLLNRRVWLEKKHSKSFLLMKLQRAFCMRQFTKENAKDGQDYQSLKKALEVLV